MRRRLTTAQKTPAGWFGTVLFLKRTSILIYTRQGEDILDVVTVFEVSISSGLREMVHSLDILHHNENAASENQQHRDDAQCADGIKAKKEIYEREVYQLVVPH